MGNKRFSQHGFTLSEILLVVGMLAIIAVSSIPVYSSLQNRNSIDLAVSSIRSSIIAAQRLSQASASDLSWSVHVGSGAAAIYPGAVYSPGAVGLSHSIPSSITVTGSTDITFAKFTGIPVATASFILTSVNSDTRTVSVNAKGIITVQ